MSLPYRSGGQLAGVLDLVQERLITSRKETPAIQPLPVPEKERETMGNARKRVHEGVAERDDRLLEQYLTMGELTQEELIDGMRLGVQTGKIVPLYSGSAIDNIGIVPLLNAIVDILPSPMDRASNAPLGRLHPDTGAAVSRRAVREDPFSGIVFKTLIDPFVGRLSFLRVLSGVLHADSTVFNSSRNSREKCGHLYAVTGKKHVALSTAGAGDIVAIGKLKDTQTGDTLCDEQAPVCYQKTALPRLCCLLPSSRSPVPTSKKSVLVCIS